MKKFFFAVTFIITLVSIFVLTKALDIRKQFYKGNAVSLSETTAPQTEATILPIDTSTWKQTQLHQNINIFVPPQWTTAIDGVYNYDVNQVTGTRDPNFPNNSFKCVFYTDKNLRANIDITEEITLNTTPKITYVDAKWNKDDSDLMRNIGSKIDFYVYKNETDEVYIECNVFKGSMQVEDKNILENIIVSINYKK